MACAYETLKGRYEDKATCGVTRLYVGGEGDGRFREKV